MRTRMRTKNKNKEFRKEFRYRSICHSDFGVNHYHATNRLIIGEIYDVYFANYPFSYEYEIFKDDNYYTSFILNKCPQIGFDGNGEQLFLNNFYSQQQMKQKIREDSLIKLGI